MTLPKSTNNPISWRNSILNQLNERENREYKPFEDLVDNWNKHFESSGSIRADYLQLVLKYKRLSSGAFVNPETNQSFCKRCPAREEKLFDYKERIRSLTERNKELVKNYEKQIDDLNIQKQLLKNEYEALQHYYDDKSKEHLNLDLKHKELINSVMAGRAEDDDQINLKTKKIDRIIKMLTSKKLEQAVEKIKISELDDQLDAYAFDSSFFSRKIHDAEVNAVKWVTGADKYRNVLATGGGDRKIKLWMVSRSSCLLLEPELTNSNASITSIDVDGEYLLASSSDFASRLWTLNDSRLKSTFTGHLNKVTAVKFLGSPAKSVSGSLDRMIKIWDINRHTCTITYFTGSFCNDIVTRQDNDSEVISGHFDKTIRFFDTRANIVSDFIKLQDPITSLDVSQNDYSLLSCDRGNRLNLFDLRMNRVSRDFCADGFRVGCNWTRATISPNSEYVAAGSSDGVIFIWNANTGKLEKELRGGHSSNVNACSWSPNGQTFISCDRSKRMTVWDQGFHFF